MRFGKSTLYDPRDPAVRHRIRYNGHDVYRLEVASLLSTFYGTDPAVVRPARQREFVDVGGPVLLCPRAWRITDSAHRRLPAGEARLVRPAP